MNKISVSNIVTPSKTAPCIIYPLPNLPLGGRSRQLRARLPPWGNGKGGKCKPTGEDPAAGGNRGQGSGSVVIP